MTAATLTSKGQVTIPKEVRDFLRLGAGDRIEFTFEEDGSVRLRRPRRSILDLAGILHQPGTTAVTLEEMQQSMLDAVAEDDERIRGYGKR